MKAYKANFSTDMEEGKIYAGYTLDELWNGWECPYFTPVETRRIIEDFNEGNTETKIYYGEKDCVYMDDEAAEMTHELIATPEIVETEDGTKKLYQFNGFTWYKEED